MAIRPTPIYLAVAALLSSNALQAAPAIGSVASGDISISQQGNVTNVNQSSQKGVINWPSFGIGPLETVNFNQPNSSAITLNRVIGNERSVLEGTLNANGKVFLLNANGVLITRGASINTAGFVASTLDMKDEDFLQGKLKFYSTGSTASVINQGTITVTDGGYVALLGQHVSNEGWISATKGTVALAAGDKITLNLNGDSLLSVTIDEGALNALAENKEAIYANGGQVFLTAKAVDDLLGAQVNNTGLIQAQTIDDLKGHIELYAHGGTTVVDGKLDASAPVSGDGGFIETSGDKVRIKNNAIITTKSAKGKSGTWLIDPTDFTIAAFGGDMTGATLSQNLQNNSLVTINAATMGSTGVNGDIFVNDAVSWSNNSTLELVAVRNINVNAALTASNGNMTFNASHDININAPITLGGATSVLDMTYGGDYNIRTRASYSGVADASGPLFDNKGNPIYSDPDTQTQQWGPVAQQDTSGGAYGSITFTNAANTNGLKINGETYTLIHSMAQLEALAPLIRDGSGQPIPPYLEDGMPPLDWDTLTPIYNHNTASGKFAIAQDLDASSKTYSGSVIDIFSGTLAGLGHKIDGLSINSNAGDLTGTGLISMTTGAVLVRDLGITNAHIASNGTSPDVWGLDPQSVGILIGQSTGALTVSKTYSTGTVTVNGGSVGGAGGLIGTIWGDGSTHSTAQIRSSFSSADVSVANSGGKAGGLVGSMVGLYDKRATIDKSHATGKIQGDAYGSSTGGLIGYGSSLDITNSYASGEITGAYRVGGLAGSIESPTGSNSVNNSFATGKVTSFSAQPVAQPSNINSATGGLIGYTQDTNVTNAYATGDVASTLGTGDARGIGGLIGVHSGGDVRNTLASGSVTAGPRSERIGGLIGLLWKGGVYNSYATGDVAGGAQVAGLIGYAGNGNAVIVDGSRAYGSVNGIRDVGGLIGLADSGTVVRDSGVYGNGLDILGRSGGSTVTNTFNYFQIRTQLLALREAQARGEAQALQAQAALAIQQAGETIQSAQRNAAVTAQQPSNSNRPPSLEDRINFADSSSYSADIKSITVDGVRFNLEEPDKAENK